MDDFEFDLYSPTSGNLSVKDGNFVDSEGRVVQLRGVNVSSSAKVPNSPLPKIHQHAQGSYVNRPFPVTEAPEHWARLASWGLHFIRINVTWDAIEHAGPGEYDTEYLAYLRELLASLKGTGLVAYVSVHQDVWSRYSGGSGAPGWTLELAGFDLSNDGKALEDSGAAVLHGVKGGRLEGERGLWPTGYQKLACATMNTLFWGGETFAPTLKVGPKGINIQSYLQDAFLGAYDQLVQAVGDLDTVMGFEMMNEPHPGYIGMATIDKWNYNTDLHLGQYPSPLQGMSLGAGHPTLVSTYVRSFPHPTRVKSKAVANLNKATAWRSDGPTAGQCPWEKEGVWKWSAEKNLGIALQEDYFSKDRSGKPIEFYQDFYFPFIRKWESVVAKREPTKAFMLEPLPNEYAPHWPEDVRPKNFVFAPHWYDLHTMFTKKFGNFTVNVQGLARGMFPLRAVYWGEEGVKDNYARQIRTLVKEARERIGNVPIVFGECGIPIDMNYEEAFKTGNWKWQERMLDALITAMELSLVHFNLWSYNPDNRDDVGDDWNAENFSWYSNDNRQKVLAALPAAEAAVAATSPDTGARLLDVLVRPYAVAVAGDLLASHYERETQLFRLRWKDLPQQLKDANASPPTERVTEVFLPSRVYGGKFRWNLSPNGHCRIDHERQRAFVWFDDDAESVMYKKHMIRTFDIWTQEPEDKATWGARLGLLFVLLIAALAFANEFKAYKTGSGWVQLHTM